MVVAACVLVGCSAGSAACRQSCYQSGIYIEPNDQLGAKSAEICVDRDCTAVQALDGPDDPFSGFNVETWREGRTVELHLTVFDRDGHVIDSLSEQ